MSRSVFNSARSRDRALRLGMWLFLASLAMLFGAGMIGYAVVRVQLGGRLGWPADLPPMPVILWLSTLTLLGSSASMQAALNAVRSHVNDMLKPMMAITLLLAVIFLIMQSIAWSGWYTAVQPMWDDGDAHRWALTSFFVMTGIHAAHVLGGLIPIALVTGRAYAGAYSRENHIGVELCAMYWHFLGAVWLILFAALWIGT